MMKSLKTADADPVRTNSAASEALINENRSDTASTEAEAAYKVDGKMFDARDALKSLRKKHSGNGQDRSK